MRLIVSPFVTIEENLTLEQLFLKRDDEYLILSKNRKSIVVGRHQVPYAEIAVRQQYQYNLPIIRRFSGGGAVFLDEGTLNYSFITNYAENKNSYSHFNNIIIKVLEKLGMNDLCEKGCNIYSKGYKISGTSQYKRADRIIHHGTLLINTDLDLLNSIFHQSANYSTKAKKSEIAQTANITDFFSDRNKMELEKSIVDIFENSFCFKRFILEDEIFKEVGLRKNDLENISWSFGNSPYYEYSNTIFLPDGEQLEVYFEVKNGKVIYQELDNQAIAGKSDFTGCYHCIDEFIPVIKENRIGNIEAEKVQDLSYQFFQ